MSGTNKRKLPVAGEYLRTRREHLGLTQQEVADASHVAQNTISKLERRTHARVTFTTVIALATALDMDPRLLRFGPDPSRRRQPIDARRRVAVPLEGR